MNEINGINELSKYQLFCRLNTSELGELLSLATEISIQAGENLVNEGDESHSFFLIKQGILEVHKKVSDKTISHKLTTINQGEIVGGMALVEDMPRCATLKAVTDTTALKFNIKAIKDNHQIFNGLSIPLCNMLSNQLRYINEVTVQHMQRELEEIKKRNALGIFMIRILYVIGIYTLSFGILEKMQSYLPSTTIISVPLIFIMVIVIFQAMRQSTFPLSTFGLTLKNWKRVSVESIIYTIPVLFIILVAKWVALTLMERPLVELIDPTPVFQVAGNFSLSLYLGSLIAYSVFCPVQEFIARGGLQTSMYKFLPGTETKRLWTAIILSNLMFALTHLHTTLGFALLAFVFGIFWGWLYAKQKSLIGVSISHILIGVWADFIVGFTHLL